MANYIKVAFMLIILVLMLWLFNSMPAFMQPYANFIIFGIIACFFGVLIIVVK